MSEPRQRLIQIVKEHGHIQTDVPMQLASGDFSRDFIDGKRALARGEHLRLATEELLLLADELGGPFDAVGGLTMGADQFAHAVALLRPEVEWFSVRKAAKERGTKQRIEGAQLGAGRRVLLVDDVVTRGGSIADALEEIRATGATVVAAVSLIDRGEFGRVYFRQADVPYGSLVTYSDLHIDPVGSDPATATATR